MDLVTRLSHLFGTEEAVSYRRQLVLLREKIMTIRVSNLEQRVICSGSLGEGVAYPRSDDDLMFVDKRQSRRVYDLLQEAAQNRALYMEPSVHSPGFCVIQDVKETGYALIRSKEFRECFAQALAMTQHGPCASEAFFLYEFDYAPCLSCVRWPTMAHEWIIRNRICGWPSQSLLQEIVKAGCHIVPIGNPDSSLCNLEWRVSFSLAERSLIHSFNHVQFVVYNFLKLILKRVIGIQVPDVLCSYFMKTVMFYSIEKFSPPLWINDKVDLCYRKCLLMLYYFIDAMNCPNFFIPENNMMRRKVNTNNKGPLLSVVAELINCGIEGSLHLCGESYVLSRGMSPEVIEWKADGELIFGYLMVVTLAECGDFFRDQNGIDFEIEPYIYKLLIIYQHASRVCSYCFLNLIFKQLYTFLGLQLIRVSIIMSDGNKSKYKIMRCGQSMLKIGCSGDVMSGRLMLANFMFLTGRFGHCLTIIQSALSKYAPYVISRQDNSGRMMYMEVMSKNGYPIHFKVQRAWAFNVRFPAENEAICPVPVRIIVASYKGRSPDDWHIILPPIVWSYFLQSLCYYQTRDHESMNISVSLLEDSVRNISSRQLDHVFYGRFLLGYTRMLQQNYLLSYRCLRSAYCMKTKLDKTDNTDHSQFAMACVNLLACLFNRVIN